VSRLIEQYGLDGTLYEHETVVTADCPRRGSTDIYTLCRAHWPDLPRVLVKGDTLGVVTDDLALATELAEYLAAHIVGAAEAEAAGWQRRSEPSST
jgi:hypothetical protein